MGNGFLVVVKEREMEIGYPTDVKHVAHIGWDSHSANAPSWMNEFKTASDFSTTSLTNISEPRDPSYLPVSTWSSLDFEQTMGRQPISEMFKDSPPPTDLPKVPKKHKRKKTKSASASSPKSSSPSSRSSRTSKSKATYNAMVIEAKTTSNLQGVLS
ncbi:hypothetical protein HHK36_023803 [Tetracentron sinense]|uniref:CRIB domain-containing protein n=1 Tax=Tetracentron sinense TaxID=13715 RepID=A0A835D5Q7_TETSI|nr:hypothetical protein HHK36_023803 [Tetracentron sinense]